MHSIYKHICALYIRVWFASSPNHQFSPIQHCTTLVENSCCILKSAQGTGWAFNIFAVPTVHLSKYSFIWNDIIILHKYLLITSYESSNVVEIESSDNKIPSLLKWPLMSGSRGPSKRHGWKEGRQEDAGPFWAPPWKAPGHGDSLWQSGTSLLGCLFHPFSIPECLFAKVPLFSRKLM